MPLPRLDLDASAPSEPSARLADFVWAGATPDLALHALPGGGRLLTRSWFADGVRRVDQYAVEHGDAELVARIRWDIDDRRFAETGRWMGPTGRNQHRRAMVLPAVMNVGEAVLPLPNARVTLAWVGVARLTLDGETFPRRCLRLYIEGGGARFDQWLAEGVGEVASGPAWGPFGSWLVAWAGGDQRWLLAVPDEVRHLALSEAEEPDDVAEVREGIG